LTAYAIYSTILDGWLARIGFVPAAQLTTWERWKNFVLLLLVLPSIYFFNSFLFRLAKRSYVVWLAFIPLNVLAIVFADFSTIQTLGVVGIFGAIVEFIITRQLRKRALQAI